MDKPSGNNFGQVKSILLIPIDYIIDRPAWRTDYINIEDILLKDETAWEQVYFTPGTCKPKIDEQDSISGTYLNVNIPFRHPKVRVEADRSFNFYRNRRVAAILTDTNNVSIFIYSLKLLRSEVRDGYFGYEINLTGRVPAYQFVNMVPRTVSSFNAEFEPYVIIAEVSESFNLKIGMKYRYSDRNDTRLNRLIVDYNGNVNTYFIAAPVVPGTIQYVEQFIDSPPANAYLKIYGGIETGGYNTVNAIESIEMEEAGIQRIHFPTNNTSPRNINLYGNAINQTDVNALIQKLNPLTPGTINISGGTSAYPVGSAYYTKKDLVDNLGFTITDNTPEDYNPGEEFNPE